MKTSYKRTYGVTLRELGARLRISHATAARWHERGQLREVLDTGRRPRYNSVFRRMYGATLKELAARRGCSISHAWQLHQQGGLAGKIISKNLRKSLDNQE